MLDAFPVPLPLLLGGLAVAALVAGVVAVWTRGRSSRDKAFLELGSETSPGAQQAASEPSEPTFEPLPPAPEGEPEPMVAANFAPDQLSLGITVPSARRRPGASMKPFKEMAGLVVTKG